MGRQEDLQLLRQGLEEQQSLVVITGGAGEGKSRLADELVAGLVKRGLVISHVALDLSEWEPVLMHGHPAGHASYAGA